MTALESEILEILATLGPEQKRQVLEYVRQLSDEPMRGVPGKSLLRFAGSIAPEDVRLMARAIEEDCEIVDSDGW